MSRTQEYSRAAITPAGLLLCAMTVLLVLMARAERALAPRKQNKE